MTDQDAATHILMQLSKCSYASDALVYLPVDSIGKIVSDALYLRNEIDRLQSRIDSLQKHNEKLLSGEK